MYALMPEIGHVRVIAPDGQAFDFVPSLAAINSLGTGAEIVRAAADLYDRRPLVALTAARCVMQACHVANDDIGPLVGWSDARLDAPGEPIDMPGAMPVPEIMAVARHLVQHGTAGKSRPGGNRGQYAQEFSVAQHLAAAQAHLGTTRAEALAMTMTEMQLLIEAKFPEAKAREVPTRDEYRKQLAAIMAKRQTKGATGAAKGAAKGVMGGHG